MNLNLPKPVNSIQKKIAQQIQWNSFKFYLAVKVSHKHLYHKKIVQIMYMKYIGYSVNLDLKLQKGEENSESMQFVYKCLKIIPVYKSLSISFQHCQDWDVKNSQQFSDIFQQMNYTRKEKLQSLTLNLEFINLQCQTLNMMHIFFGIIQLKQLKSLKIYFNGNNLGEKDSIMMVLKQGFLQLKNLNSLSLDFDSNQLGINEQNIIGLGESLKELKKLRYLNLGLQNNNLGSNENNFKLLGVSFQELNDSLKHLSLNLNYNQFGGFDNDYETKCRNIMYLGSELSKLDELEKLEISLRINYLSSNTLGGLVNGLKKLNKLKILRIILEGVDKKDMEKIKYQFSILKIWKLIIQ